MMGTYYYLLSVIVVCLLFVLVPELNTLRSPQVVEGCVCGCFQLPRHIGSHTPTSGDFRGENCSCWEVTIGLTIARPGFEP